MPLKKKIILSFFITSAIIVSFVVATYLGFIESRREIRYLELSDTIRSKSLLLRRHEKNFFLYGDDKERRYVHTYLKELKIILKEDASFDNPKKLQFLNKKIDEYSRGFSRIENLAIDFQKGFAQLKLSFHGYVAFFPIIESTFLERPLVNAELLEKIFSLKGDAPIIKTLKYLVEINALRKNGEEVLNLTNELDKSARAKVEGVIHSTGFAALVFFPLFFGLGFVLLLVITHSVVSRLKVLTAAVEKTGKGEFPSLSIPEKQDEVGVLVKAFDKMEKDLLAREKEINKKNEELLQSRKLASIGTLASGVAHELNNPLNNIYLAAQTLSKEIDQENYPQIVRESVGDIFSQTLRVKRIVGDLLEFTKEMSPEIETIDIVSMIQQILNQMKTRGELAGIKSNFKSPQELKVFADRHLLQQAFVNLFSNAVEAMGNNGLLDVEIDTVGDDVLIKVSDTGKGILPENIPRIFDPFFTTKEKGTGLGLAIVYNIIKRHHGRIEVSSVSDKGTTFTVTLPKQRETRKESTD
ncbi:MAG: ATP-binding protein [Nitrospirota bacterium]